MSSDPGGGTGRNIRKRGRNKGTKKSGRNKENEGEEIRNFGQNIYPRPKIRNF